MPPIAVAPSSPNRNSTRRYRHSQLRRLRDPRLRLRGGAARRREAGARRAGAERGRVSVADDILAWGVRGEGTSVPTARVAPQEHQRHETESGGRGGPGSTDVVGAEVGGSDPSPGTRGDDQPRAE